MWFNPERNIEATTHSEIRSACPQVSMPAHMTDDNIQSVGFVLVLESPQPEGTEMTRKWGQPPLFDGNEKWGQPPFMWRIEYQEILF